MSILQPPSVDPPSSSLALSSDSQLHPVYWHRRSYSSLGWTTRNADYYSLVVTLSQKTVPRSSSSGISSRVVVIPNSRYLIDPPSCLSRISASSLFHLVAVAVTFIDTVTFESEMLAFWTVHLCAFKERFRCAAAYQGLAGVRMLSEPINELSFRLGSDFTPSSASTSSPLNTVLEICGERYEIPIRPLSTHISPISCIKAQAVSTEAVDMDSKDSSRPTIYAFWEGQYEPWNIDAKDIIESHASSK
ncbi:hypothetical protein D9757_009821 [Collybiopsis confluens]|uniref:Uncharacterized protein n=1 Tax=Collybiopsis confluens TaxID=2823264 RepID=A0A8H5M692_9AGAR|nr:hypothetical protein D9757_009821 [Collybiopsis confluens]